MPPDPELEEEYASSEDSDFAPEEGAQRESSPEGSDDEADAEPTTSTTRKRQAADHDADDAGFENSGDEAIIQKGKNKRRKKAKVGDDGTGDREEGGEGGLIKTRSQRALEKAERKAAAVTGPVTIDVDLLWAQMNSPAPDKLPTQSAATKNDGPLITDDKAKMSEPVDAEPSTMIKIKRTYNFAGKVHTEEKLVARDSAEAKLYLASLGDGAEVESAEVEGEPKRKPRKAFRSAFEPVSDSLSHRTDLNLGIAARMQARDQAQGADAKKLTTVEKSRMDWAGYVDKEGIKDELTLAGKSKHSYAEREGFLARSEARREDDARKARMATRA